MNVLNLRYNEKEDKRQVIFDDIDFSEVHQVFEYLHDQCVEDGNLNELSQVLRSLLFIPREFHYVWNMCEELLAHVSERFFSLLLHVFF